MVALRRLSLIVSVLAAVLAETCLCLAADRLFVPWNNAYIDRFELPDRAPVRVVDQTIEVEFGGACSPDGLLYFSGWPSSGQPVQRWDQDGSGHAGGDIPNRDRVAGIAFDLKGDLYVNSYGDDGIYLFPGGDLSLPAVQVLPPYTLAGWGAALVRGGPHAGALLFGDRDGRRIVISEPPGSPVRPFIDASRYPVQFTELMGIATTPCGEVFVGVFEPPRTRRIDRFDAEGNFLDVYVSGTPGDYLEFDSEGNLFAAAGLARPERINVIAPDRTVAVFEDFNALPVAFVLCREPLACLTGAPPVSECSGPRTCIGLSAAPRRPCMEYAWSSDCPGADFGGSETSATPTLCMDTQSCPVECSVTLASKEGVQSATCSSAVRIEDRVAPRLRDVPADAGVECDAVPPPPVVRAEDACDPDPRVAFAERRRDGPCPGEYRLDREWTARDDCGNSSIATAGLDVRDTKAPEVEPGAEDLHCLWPPNHRMVCFETGDFAPRVHDACSEPVTWRFASCRSDQSEDDPGPRPRRGSGQGNGDGHTSPDCVVSEGGGEVCVRAERAGGGPRAQLGRRYQIAVVAEDACGNTSAEVVIGTIHVPHDSPAAGAGCR